MEEFSLNLDDVRPSTRLVSREVLERAKARTDVQARDYPSIHIDVVRDKKGKPPTTASLVRPDKICASALELVGKTPMVRLDRLARYHQLECELVAKCEFMSVGGSVKDRVALRMIEDAEKNGELTGPQDVLVEATSGNTGVALCLAGAVKGYKTVIALPQKMSQEKLATMVALGAEIIRTPTEAAWNDPDSHLTLATQLEVTLPHAHFLDQYRNIGNPQSHYDTTAEEILYQCDEKLEMIVIGSGTGGTVTGIGTKLKERCPNCTVVAVDPYGSVLARPDSKNDKNRNCGYLVEGVGYDFVPPTLHHDVVDVWVKTDDLEAFRIARQLIRLEGLLVGGSSGSALAGALKMAKNLKKGDRCVVVLPDSCRNYMTKFVTDDWMTDNKFFAFTPSLSTPWKDKSISAIKSIPQVVCVREDAKCKEGIQKLAKENAALIVAIDTQQKPVGILTPSSLTALLAADVADLNDPVHRHMTRSFRVFDKQAPLIEAVQSLKSQHTHVVIKDGGRLIGTLTAQEVLCSLEGI